MKINIKKFMELSNISFETPTKIEAGHDVGKSTIFRAVLFAITGRDVDGKEFDGRIYPKKVQSISDLTVEVEIEQIGVTFTKKATGSEKRTKGSDEIELQRSVTCSYMIDFQIVNKTVYDAKIQEVFGNFQLFCNPDYFRGLNKDEKRKIFSSLVNIDKNSYFIGLSDKKTISGRITDQKKQISEKQATISELSKVQEPEKIDVVDYESHLSELRKQRDEATPKFTPEELAENSKINQQIAELEKSVFIPEPIKPLFPLPVEPDLIDVEKLQLKFEETKLSEPKYDFLSTRIEQVKSNIEKVKALTLQIENYDENVKNSKCTLCQVCTASDCQFKRIEMKSLDELQNELSQFEALEFIQKNLENYESQLIDYKRDFEHNKNEEIFRFENEISESKKINERLIFEADSELKEIIIKNSKISSENEKIKSKNAENLANFDTSKAQQISELKGKLHTLPAFDYSEIDNQIEEIELKKLSQQISIDANNKEIGAFNYASNQVKILTDEVEKMKQALYASERELIKIEDAENRYYSDFENKINSEMPENVRVSLFKKNLSNDDYSECFEIEFNGSIYAGNGKTIAFYIWLCSWFQSKFGKDLPIFIDEAIILNEKLYSDVKNTVILMRNDECKTLKISEL